MAQPSATLTLFVLDQTQQSWSQSTHTLTHAAARPTLPTYNLSPLPSQLTHLGWGGNMVGYDIETYFSCKYSRSRHLLRSVIQVIYNENRS